MACELSGQRNFKPSVFQWYAKSFNFQVNDTLTLSLLLLLYFSLCIFHLQPDHWFQLAEEMTEDLFRDLDNQGLVRRRLHGAPLKDTVPIPDGGYLVLRLEANNPGGFTHKTI